MNFLNNFFSQHFVRPRYFKILFGPLKGLKIFIAPRHGIKKILGIYEPDVVKVIKNNVKLGNFCVDAGCHVGYISLVLRKFIGETGFVLAIDPIDSNCKLVNKSAVANGFKNIKTGSYALGDVNAQTSAYTFDDSNMANFTDSGFVNYSNKNAQNFCVKTLDSVMSDENLLQLHFIKIDVEGYEYKVLLGAQKLIKKFHPTCLIEVHSSKIWPAIFDFLTKEHYEFYDLSEMPVTKETYLNTSNIFHVLAKVSK
jgi:FkbM family methyltransferase